MFGMGEVFGAQVSAEAHQALSGALRALSQMVREAADARGIPPGRNPFIRPCDFVVVIDNATIFLVLDEERSGPVPTHTYLDLRDSPVLFSLDDVMHHARREHGLRSPLGVILNRDAISDDDATRKYALAPAVHEICERLEERELLETLSIPSGYEHLRRFMPAFLADHPRVDRNVFLMMRFKTGKQFQEIERVIRETLGVAGYQVMRADDKTYASELWDNVVVYMLGCAFGITVFEEIEDRKFNPSVALELGFMLALNKRCLILKDKSMEGMPTDIVGRLYRPFDTYDVPTTLGAALASWLKDIS